MSIIVLYCENLPIYSCMYLTLPAFITQKLVTFVPICVYEYERLLLKMFFVLFFRALMVESVLLVVLVGLRYGRIQIRILSFQGPMTQFLLLIRTFYFQMAMRPRLKRVNIRDLLFLLEQEKDTMRSQFLYKHLLSK